MAACGQDMIVFDTIAAASHFNARTVIAAGVSTNEASGPRHINAFSQVVFCQTSKDGGGSDKNATMEWIDLKSGNARLSILSVFCTFHSTPELQAGHFHTHDLKYILIF